MSDAELFQTNNDTDNNVDTVEPITDNEHNKSEDNTEKHDDKRTKERKKRKPLSAERKKQLCEQLKKAREISKAKRSAKSKAKKEAVKQVIESSTIPAKDININYGMLKNEIDGLKDMIKGLTVNRELQHTKKIEQQEQQHTEKIEQQEPQHTEKIEQNKKRRKPRKRKDSIFGDYDTTDTELDEFRERKKTPSKNVVKPTAKKANKKEEQRQIQQTPNGFYSLINGLQIRSKF